MHPPSSRMVIFLWATMSVRLVPTCGKNAMQRDHHKLSHWELLNITLSLSHYYLNPNRPSLEVLGPKAEPNKEED